MYFYIMSLNKISCISIWEECDKVKCDDILGMSGIHDQPSVPLHQTYVNKSTTGTICGVL